MPADVDVVLKLARSVAANEHAIYLKDVDGNKVRDGYTDISSAVVSGRPFMVDLRDGVVAIDVDRSEGDELCEAAIEAARAAGAAVVRVGSGREDNEHVFVNGPVGWTSANLRDLLVDHRVAKAKIRYHGGDVRPPLSPHPSGSVGEMIEPRHWQTALHLLSGRPGATRLDHARWLQILETGIGYKRRRDAILAFGVACANAGESPSNFRRWVVDSRLAEVALAEKDPTTWLDKIWSTAMQRVRERPPETQWMKTQRVLRNVARSYPWTGRTGETDRRVYAFLVEQAGKVFRPSVACDQRRIAEATGADRKTVARSLARLKVAGLVRFKAGAGRQAAEYTLLTEVEVNDANSSYRPPSKTDAIGVIDTNFDISLPDAFRSGGLPAAAFATWNALPRDCSAATVNELAVRRPGTAKPATIRAHLRALHSAGLVDRNRVGGQKWWRRPEADLERLAEQLGTAGAKEQQHVRHMLEREIFDLSRQEFIARTRSNEGRPAAPTNRDTSVTVQESVATQAEVAAA